MFFITNEGPVTGGYDVVMGSKGLARAWGRHLIENWGGKSQKRIRPWDEKMVWM